MVGHARRQHKMRIVGLRAFEIVDHEVAAARLDRPLETLDSDEEIGQILGPFVPVQGNSPPPQTIRHLSRHCPDISTHGP